MKPIIKYKILFFACCIALLMTACTTDDNAPSLSIPEKDSERVEMELSVESASSPFYYLIQAKETIINWGDGTKPLEYVFLGDIRDLNTLNPIQRSYASGGTYRLKISTYRPLAFNFSRGIEGESVTNQISELKLTNCWNLRELYCKNQSQLTTLDLKSCDNLRILNITGSGVNLLDLKKENKLDSLVITNTQIEAFDCTYIGNIQQLAIGNNSFESDIQNIPSLKRLKTLSVEGNIKDTHLNLIQNDSLQTVSLTNTNMATMNLSQLKFLKSILIGGCNCLSAIKIAENPQLKNLHLVNNPSLSAQQLNAMFTALPAAGDVSRIITLKGNGGDDTCDRSIATRKGWVFRAN